MSEQFPKYGPKKATHPSIGNKCLACHRRFEDGDFTTLVSLGPGDDPEARSKAFYGQAYNAVAVEVHYACAAGEPSDAEA